MILLLAASGRRWRMSAPQIRLKPKRGATNATSIAVVKIARTTSDGRGRESGAGDPHQSQRQRTDEPHQVMGVDPDRRRPTVMNKPPSRPSVQIHPTCAIHSSSAQSSTVRAKRSSGSSSSTALGNVRRYSTSLSANQCLHLGEGVAVFLWMLILIAQPGLASRRLVPPIAQDGIEGHDPKSRQPRDHPAEAERHPRERVVDAEDDDAARAGQLRQAARTTCADSRV